jgi:hypothetical protein
MYTDHDQLRWWRQATGLTEPGFVPLGLTIEQGTLRIRLHRAQPLPAKLIQQMLGTAKPPKAKRHAPVKLASLPDGQEAEYNRIMGRVA